VVFHSKSSERPKSAFEPSEKHQQLRKTSMSNDMLSKGDNNGNTDENLNFIKEEIAPGKLENRKLSKAIKVCDLFAGIVVEGDVFDL
jgi:hypothetical protein